EKSLSAVILRCPSLYKNKYNSRRRKGATDISPPKDQIRDWGRNHKSHRPMAQQPIEQKQPRPKPRHLGIQRDSPLFFVGLCDLNSALQCQERLVQALGASRRVRGPLLQEVQGLQRTELLLSQRLHQHLFGRQALLQLLAFLLRELAQPTNAGAG